MFPTPMQDPREIDKLEVDGAISRLSYVGDAITLTRHKIDGKVPLIGFTGAPVREDFAFIITKLCELTHILILRYDFFVQFTLMGYMIEGGGSKTMSKTKDWLERIPKDVHKLLKLLTGVIIDYLVMQVTHIAYLPNNYNTIYFSLK